MVIWIVVALVVIAAAVGLMFNSLIRAKNRTDEAWSDIDVQLKRRHDLIPNLVETVKGYAAHEAGVFEKVTAARTAAINAAGQPPAEQEKAENVLTGALKSVFAVAENYPDLKASQNFLELQQQLEDTENKIQAARRFYNGNVRDFNTKLQTIPTNLVGSLMGLKARDFFGLDEPTDRDPVAVKF
jgi:LemA protein